MYLNTEINLLFPNTNLCYDNEHYNKKVMTPESNILNVVIKNDRHLNGLMYILIINKINIKEFFSI